MAILDSDSFRDVDIGDLGDIGFFGDIDINIGFCCDIRCFCDIGGDVTSGIAACKRYTSDTDNGNCGQTCDQ
ncbi:MAG: hypothetical protein FDX30_08110 [Chlorobium sp.]|nr:MAG: hypothetical protein FDX30_08110 [Chlorobium sp.]